VKLTNYLHIVPRSKMLGAIPPLPQYIFMAWCLVKHREKFTFTFTFTFTFIFFPCFNFLFCTEKSRDSSVGRALGYGLDDRGSRVRFLAGAGNFSLHHRVQNGSGAHPASYPMGTRGSFPGSKAAGA
jgi:hypothetical protein